VTRFRKASKAALAVGAILAMPLFFASLMAMSLAFEKPTIEHVMKNGESVEKLGDPSGTTELTIWLLALVAPAAVVLVGAAATFIGRLGVIASAVAAIVASIVLLVPLGTWTDRHTARYPDGVDLTPKSSVSDVYLKGEWEGTARTTVRQLGIVTIVLGSVAMGVLAVLEIRRRRGVKGMVVPPPPALAEGQSQIVRGGVGRRWFGR
jgi:hypothetical protein